MNESIDALPVKVQAVIDNQIERLGVLGPDLGFPHTSQVSGELRELRCHYGADLYRILYRRSRNLFVLLHFFAKGTARVPDRDIRIAQDRWDDFVDRMNTQLRRPPRPAGRDAP